MKKFISNITNKITNFPKTQAASNLFQGLLETGDAIISIFDSTGIAGFKFHVPQNEMVKFESEATDYYVDNNSAVQDHIIQKPITITLEGFTGDYYYSLHELEDKVSVVAKTLTCVSAFLPSLTNITKVKKEELAKIATSKIKDVSKSLLGYETESNVLEFSDYDFNLVDLFQIIQNLYKLKSAQTRAFYYLEALWKSKSIFTVETSWKRYNNMIITSLQATRDNNADITDFKITFKQINVTETLIYSPADKAKNRTSDMLTSTIKKGVSSGVKFTVNALNNFKSKFSKKNGLYK